MSIRPLLLISLLAAPLPAFSADAVHEYTCARRSGTLTYKLISAAMNWKPG